LKLSLSSRLQILPFFLSELENVPIFPKIMLAKSTKAYSVPQKELPFKINDTAYDLLLSSPIPTVVAES